MERFKCLTISQIRFDNRQVLSKIQSCETFPSYFIGYNQPMFNKNIPAYE